MKKENKGITLIALVITIIILLILAGVGISLLLGDNGILNKAQAAAEETKQEQIDEEVDLIIGGIQINSALKPGKTIAELLAEAKVEGEIENFTVSGNKLKHDETGNEYLIRDGFTVLKIQQPKEGWKLNVEIIADKVPIPKGFEYLTGERDTGLVITDSTNIDLSDGNEFVWVPVTNLANVSAELQASVTEYGGFYIGRYEASYGSGTIAVGDHKPYSKQSTVAKDDMFLTNEKHLWNYVIYSEALAACENMYNISSVTSHLPYDAQWEATLQWLINSGALKENEVNNDSRSWGQYNNSTFPNWSAGLKNTGCQTATKKNNIFDLAGNLGELVQRVENGKVASRGGRFLNPGNEATAKHVFWSDNTPTGKNGMIGFRTTLYINK